MVELAAALPAAMPVPPETLDLPLQQRHDVRLLSASLAAETRTVEVVWPTGGEVRRTDLWTGKPYHEALSLEPGHVDLTREAPTETDDTAIRAIAERVLREERERVAGITDAARKLGLDTAVADDLVRRGIGLDEARRSLIDKAAEQDRTIETRPHHIRAGGLDEVTTRRATVESALLHRFDPGRHALSEPARDWRGLSLIEMARSLLESAGERPRGLSRDEIATRALHSTSDFPAILAAVSGKTLRDAYEAAPGPSCRSPGGPALPTSSRSTACSPARRRSSRRSTKAASPTSPPSAASGRSWPRRSGSARRRRRLPCGRPARASTRLGGRRSSAPGSEPSSPGRSGARPTRGPARASTPPSSSGRRHPSSSAPTTPGR